MKHIKCIAICMVFVVGVVFLSNAFTGKNIATAQSSDATHFYFVQITDTHWGDADHLDRTRKVVARIKTLPMEIKCVAHTGDITMRRLDDKNIVSEGLEILQELNVPIYYVSGNWDILPQKLLPTYQAYVENFGDPITQTEYENVIFRFMYTEPLRESFTIEDYSPLEQLEEYLKKSDGKPVIIFHHAPSVENFYNNAMHTGWEDDLRKRWVELLNQYNVKAVIAGHFHKDEHHWLGNVPLYVSSSIAGYDGRQATFRIYEYRNGKLGYRTQYVQ